MYESPVNIICDEMRTQIEGDVFKAIQNVGINVDKDKLIKALMYDRHQYEKGYSDGYAKGIDEFAERLKSDEFQKYNLDMVFETSKDLSYSNCINAFHEYIDEIAEQFKGGAV